MCTASTSTPSGAPTGSGIGCCPTSARSRAATCWTWAAAAATTPIEHIEQLRNQLKDDGELVLETLVVDGDENQVLMPSDRYGKMRNVWFLPSSAALTRWVERCGFTDVRIVDENMTSTDEHE